MRTNHSDHSRPHKAQAQAVGIFLLTVLALLLPGCTASHYRKSADKQTYGIIQQLEARIFGATNDFTINTPYSGRPPKTISPEELIASRETSNRLVLNLEKSLNLAIAQSREYQSAKEQLYLTSLSLTGVKHEFSPQFFATVSPQISGTPSGSEIASSGTQFGVDQLLKTGGRLSLSLGNDLVRYFTGKPDVVARNSAINTLSVSLTQPLLRGFGINDPLVENLTQTERNVVYAVRSFSLFQQTFAVDIVNSYFGLLTQKDIVRNNFRNYTNRVDTTRFLEARAVDRERKSSVDDARSAELSARNSYVNSLALYLNSLDAFKIDLGLAITDQIYVEDGDLQDLVQTGVDPVNLDPAAGFQLCLQKQMEILNAIDRFEDSKRKVRIAADQLRGDVNLFATSTLASEGPDDYANFDPEKVRYTAGVRINLPIDRLRERNLYRASLISFESQLRSLTLTLDTYRDRIDRGIRSVEQARMNYINGLESLRVAERRVDNNAMLLEFGRTTFRDLREAQDNLIQAQNTLVVLTTAYLGARLNLLVSIGILDIKPEKFWLHNPIKTQFAPNMQKPPVIRMPDDQVVPPERFLEPSS